MNNNNNTLQVVWYDIRNFSEPTDRLVLDLTAGVNEPSLQNAIGISTLEFEPTIQTKFMVGEFRNITDKYSDRKNYLYLKH